MEAFVFFLSFYGLLFGLAVAALTSGLAGALERRRQVRLGWLTPLLCLFMLMDIASFLLFAWANRNDLNVGYATVTAGLLIAAIYNVAASLVFPKDWTGCTSLDDHYRAHKRIVIAGIAVSNVAVLAWTVATHPSQVAGWPFWAWQLAYWGPLTGLLFSRRATLDPWLLTALIAQYLALASGVV